MKNMLKSISLVILICFSYSVAATQGAFQSVASSEYITFGDYPNSDEKIAEVCKKSRHALESISRWWSWIISPSNVQLRQAYSVVLELKWLLASVEYTLSKRRIDVENAKRKAYKERPNFLSRLIGCSAFPLNNAYAHAQLVVRDFEGMKELLKERIKLIEEALERAGFKPAQ